MTSYSLNTDNIKCIEDFQKIDIEKRKAESQRIKLKYPNRIPLILFKDKKSNLPQINRYKYLIPGDLTLAQFIQVIRKKIKLTPEKAIFIFTEDNTLVKISDLIYTLYTRYKNEDGFLYLIYYEENTFG
jgi:GABA(A) receptor-associated protein